MTATTMVVPGPTSATVTLDPNTYTVTVSANNAIGVGPTSAPSASFVVTTPPPTNDAVYASSAYSDNTTYAA